MGVASVLLAEVVDNDPHAEEGGDGPDGGVEGVIWEHVYEADG